MPKTSKTPRSAEEIAEMATRGEDISAYFTNKFTVVRPVEHSIALLVAERDKLNLAIEVLQRSAKRRSRPQNNSSTTLPAGKKRNGRNPAHGKRTTQR
jgi:hypothetical protein